MQTPAEFISPQYSMISGQGEAVTRKYHLHIGKSGHTWLVADQDNAGDNIYVTAHKDPNKRGEGFGGSTLELELVDGGTFKLHGGWHSNPHSLLDDTGIDHTQHYRTFVVLANEKDVYDPSGKGRYSGQYRYTQIVYIDPEGGMIGAHDRYKELEKQFPEAKFFYMESTGGSASGPTASYRKVINQERNK